ncbi:MAG: penicillin-binding protein activator [Alphaproteobacteria bacterium]
MTKRSLFLFASALLLCVSCAPSSPRHKGGQAVKTRAPHSAETMMAPGKEVATRGVIPPGTPAIKVALLVPLSGESAPLGTAMLDAANMALYDSYLSVPSDQIHSQIVLLPKDSGSTPVDSANVAEQAVAQGVKFIVGPLFSQSVSQVKPVVQGRNIPILAFSNTKEIADSNTFIFGFLPEQQVQRMADYAFLNNYTRVALLAPNDAYGQRIQERLLTVYGRKGGLVKPIEQYAPSPTNIDAAVGRLAAFNDTNKDQAFQAIFIADGGYQLRNIISSIKKTNIDLNQIKLLGTGLWDDPEIAKIPEMRGAWFSSSTPSVARSFENRFQVLYGYKPVRLASLAYDAVSQIARISLSQSSEQLDMSQLTDPEGFISPANGLVRLLPDGTNDRKLAIIEITPSGFKVIDSAPTSFKVPGQVLE